MKFHLFDETVETANDVTSIILRRIFGDNVSEVLESLPFRDTNALCSYVVVSTRYSPKLIERVVEMMAADLEMPMAIIKLMNPNGNKRPDGAAIPYPVWVIGYTDIGWEVGALKLLDTVSPQRELDPSRLITFEEAYEESMLHNSLLML